MLRKINIILFSALLLSSFIPFVHAETPLDLKIDEAMKIDLSIDDQLYPSKNIMIKLKINSLIDSSKVGITWFYDDEVIKRIGSETDIISLSKDNESIVYKEFEPFTKYTLKKDHDITISVKIVAAAYDRNYVNTEELDFKLNQDFEITPLLNSYITHRDVYNLLVGVLYFVLAVLLIVLITLGVKRFLIYLDSD